MKRRRNALSLLLACVAALGIGTQTVQAQGNLSTEEPAAVVVASTDPADYDGEVLVEYRDGTYAVCTYEEPAELETLLAELASEENVALVQPNYPYESTALSTGDAFSGLQWALSNDGSFSIDGAVASLPIYSSPLTVSAGESVGAAAAAMPLTPQTPSTAGIDINAEEAWAIYGSGSRDVVVALIDTGVDTGHPDLQGSFWINTDEIAGNGIDDDGNGYIDDTNGWNFYENSNRLYSGTEDSHGTHAAGTIAAQSGNGVGISGIARAGRVKLMVLKALGGNGGSGSSMSVIQAIQYAQANGASICNLSLGTVQNDLALYRAIANSSMLFVAAAGNDGINTDVTPCYPASYPLDNVISVANLTSSGTLHTTSNYGAASVDLAAPGTYILSTVPGSYAFMSGTSMAAPMVTAAAAMVYTYYDGITLADVKRTLLSTTSSLPALQGKTATGGMLDLAAALSVPREQMTGGGFQNVMGANAPQISIALRKTGWTSVLQVRVTDADGDLYATAYNAGALTAEQFQGGANGLSFPLDLNSESLFYVYTPGTYSFYARDLAGHETVASITVDS